MNCAIVLHGLLNSDNNVHGGLKWQICAYMNEEPELPINLF